MQGTIEQQFVSIYTSTWNPKAIAAALMQTMTVPYILLGLGFKNTDLKLQF
jgi:hypothetical protein